MGTSLTASFASTIVFFISFPRKLKLIIEVDGYSHNFKYEKDKLRDKQLKKLGYMIVRFSEQEICNDLDNVVRILESYLPEKH